MCKIKLIHSYNKWVNERYDLFTSTCYGFVIACGDKPGSKYSVPTILAGLKKILIWHNAIRSIF